VIAAGSLTRGVIGLMVAVIVPVGARNVIACVNGVVTVVLLEAIQMQNTYVPGVGHA
jgi:hypothetical protein